MPGANQKYAEVWKELGMKVQFLRKTAGLSQAKLAEKIEKTEDTISNIERGIGCTKLETLIDVCDALDTTLIDLLADYLNIGKSKIKIIQGLTSRNKIIEVEE